MTEQESATITVEAMRALVQRLTDLREVKEKVEEELKEINADLSALKTKILQALQATGQDKFVAKGLGTVSIKRTDSVTTPKTVEERQALWQYIQDKYGPDAAWAKFNINSQSLNSFFKEEREAIQDALDKSLFKLPGVGEPQTFLDISFRSK